MNIKALIISVLLLNSMPFAAHSADSGPFPWMSYRMKLECPTDPTFAVQVNSLSEPEVGKPIAAEIENLTGHTLALDLVLKQDAFEGRLRGYITGFNKVTLKTSQNYPMLVVPARSWLTVKLDKCVPKASGK